jgi:integrase
MFLSKSRQGIYYVWYTNSLGKRQKISTHSRRKFDAMVFMRTFSPDEHAKKLREQRVTYKSFLATFLPYTKTIYAHSTQEIYERALEHLRSITGDIPLSSLTAQHTDLYKAKRLQAGILPASINLEIRAIRSALNYALRWKLIDQNPFSGVKQLPIPDKAPAYFQRDDFVRLVSLIKEPWLKEIVLFAVSTGMRRSEITNLTWDRVDLVRRVVTVESSQTFQVKAGKKRTIPLSDLAMDLLSKKTNEGPAALVFTLDGEAIRANWLTHAFKKYVRRAKVDDSLKFHSLRASFASWLVIEGIDIFAVSKLLGHSDVKMTQKHYAHLRPETLRDEVNTISQLLNGSSDSAILISTQNP